MVYKKVSVNEHAGSRNLDLVIILLLHSLKAVPGIGGFGVLLENHASEYRSFQLGDCSVLVVRAIDHPSGGAATRVSRPDRRAVRGRIWSWMFELAG